MSEGLGRGFSRDVEAILQIVHTGAAIGETFIYPHEVRENLRQAGMRLDNGLPELQNPWAPPAGYEPDFSEPIEPDEYPEEDENV
jgi:hypothetical protein